MSDTATTQNGKRGYTKHGDSSRQRRLRRHGLGAIDGRTAEGKEALAWRAAALKAKGAACPYWIKIEIRLACFDLWRLLCLQSWLIADAGERGTIINKRYRVLPSINAQYNEIDLRFMKRVEALDIPKGGGLDLARRLMSMGDNGATR